MSESINDFMAVMDDVMEQIETGADKFGEGRVGTAYIDWGVSSDIWQNCPNKEIADRVASEMQRGGYRVYVQRMGFGRRDIPQGTSVCYRIYAEGIEPNSPMEEWRGL